MILYHCARSSHSRFVLLVARNLDIELDLRSVGLSSDEQFSKEFLVINPLHQVPVLKDYEFKLTESRAIACFLANSDKKGFKIYPIDPLERAHVDQYLYMDATYVVPTIVRNIITPIKVDQEEQIYPAQQKEIWAMLTHLENILKETKYFAAETTLSPTLADMSILGSIAFLFHMGVSFTKYPKLLEWYEGLKTLEGWFENDLGAQTYGKPFTKFWEEPKEPKKKYAF